MKVSNEIEIKSESDITPVSVTALRAKLKLTQREFWPAVTVPAARGGFYENGRSGIPHEVRRLVYLHYVAGIPTDATSSELAGLSKKIVEVREVASKAQGAVSSAASMVDKAADLLRKAESALDA